MQNMPNSPECPEWRIPLSDAPIALDITDNVTPSAVLVVISADSAPVVVLTRRAAHLKKHAGQISFPGGRVDDTDASLADTALREAFEEIGLRPDMVNIVGYLPDMLTGTGYRITPVVAQSNLSYEQLAVCLAPNPAEVESILFVPLALVLNKHNYDSFVREDNVVSGGVSRAVSWQSWRVAHEEHVIWGATAAILHHWANALS